MERRIHSILLVALLVAAMLSTCSPLSTFAESVSMSTKTMNLTLVDVYLDIPSLNITVKLTDDCGTIEGANVTAHIGPPSYKYMGINGQFEELGKGLYRWVYEPTYSYYCPLLQYWRYVEVSAAKENYVPTTYTVPVDFISVYARFWMLESEHERALNYTQELQNTIDCLNATYQQTLEENCRLQEENHCLNDTLNTLNTTYQQTLEDNRCLTLNVEEISPDVDRILIIYRLIDSSGECTEGANVTATFKVAHYMGPLDENCIPPMNLPYEPSRGYNQYLLMFGTEHFSSLSTVIVTVTATKDNLTTSHILHLRQPYVMGEQQRRSEKNDLQRIISAKDEFLFLSGLAIVCISVVAAAGILYYRRKAQKRPT